MYVELQVPTDGSSLNNHIEDYFNTSSVVGTFCENGCRNLVQSEKRSTLSQAAETEFLTVILTRAIETMDGFKLDRNEIVSTNDIWIRYI